MLKVIIDRATHKDGKNVFLIQSSNEDCLCFIPLYKFNSVEECLLASALWVAYYKYNPNMQKYFKDNLGNKEINHALYLDFINSIWEPTRRILMNEQNFDWFSYPTFKEDSKKFGINTGLRYVNKEPYYYSVEKNLTHCVFKTEEEVYIFEMVYVILAIILKNTTNAFQKASNYIGAIFRLVGIESEWE